MKKFLTGFWKFINSKVFVYILVGISLFLLINLWNSNSDLKDESERKDRNIIVLNDKVKNEQLKNGEYQSSIAGYEASVKELQQYNKKLADEVKKEKGKVITYSNLVFRLRQDSADLAKQIDELKKLLEETKVNDSTWNMDWTLPFIYDSLNFDIFYGRTQVGIQGKIPKIFLEEIKLKHNNTWLLNRDSQMKLSWGQKYENGKIKIFAKTNHPAFEATLMEGVYVDYPKKQRWFTGWNISISTTIGYDIINKKYGILIGPSFSYSIYNW